VLFVPFLNFFVCLSEDHALGLAWFVCALVRGTQPFLGAPELGEPSSGLAN
jgi:hypothetical protein